MATTALAPAEDPYEVLAPAYDTILAAYDHHRWLDAIERAALDCGLRGRRVLDVACGSGASFLPLLERGYEVEACDLSPAMLARAREAAAGHDVALHELDMRRLPLLGEFDLVLCLSDCLNHLLSPGDVTLALEGMARNLAPGGVLVFDVNTLAVLRRAFSASWSWRDDDRTIIWEGLGAPDLEPGGETAAALTVRDGDEAPATTIIRERHHPLSRLTEQLRDAGLEAVRVLGQRLGVQLSPEVDEARDDKALVIARGSAG